MRRLGLIALITLLVLSLAGNALLGWAAWTAQKEYRALTKQFVKAKQDLAAAKAAPIATAAAPASKAASSPAPPPATQPAAAYTAPLSTTEAIRDRYSPRLLTVQTECEGQLNALLNSAKAEYNQAKAAGTNVDVAALGAKYLGRADSLRRQCDAKVDRITADMAGELRASGLPLDLVTEVREAYEARIVERQAEIMAKAP